MDVGNAVCFTMNLGLATLHVDGLLWFYCLVGANNFTKSGPFLFAKVMVIRHFYGHPGNHPGCIPATLLTYAKYSSYTGVSSYYTKLFMQLPG